MLQGITQNANPVEQEEENCGEGDVRMRLIDADAINPYDVFKGESDFAKDIRSGVIDLIKLQPTVDPVKHGRWHSYQQSRFYGIDEYGEPIFRDGCSVYVHRKCGWKSVIKSAYCPRCGAKMDEVEE